MFFKRNKKFIKKLVKIQLNVIRTNGVIVVLFRMLAVPLFVCPKGVNHFLISHSYIYIID